MTAIKPMDFYRTETEHADGIIVEPTATFIDDVGASRVSVSALRNAPADRSETEGPVSIWIDLGGDHPEHEVFVNGMEYRAVVAE